MKALVEVGLRVFALRYRFYDQQIGVVVGDDGVLVIDTRSSHRQADEILRDIRTITALPVSVVVNTHGHHDHAFGNRVFRPAPIWGHRRCAIMLTATGDRQRAEVAANSPGLADELASVEIDPPDQTIDDTATIDVGGRPVELRYLGRGHTDNDIVVRVPDAGVLFSGDLLENGAPPYFGDGYPIDWPATVEMLASMVDGAVVPGHGDVGDATFVAAQLADLRAIAGLAGQVHRGDLAIDDAIKRAPFPVGAAREPLERGLAQLRGELGEPAVVERGPSP
ncbi:MAG: MBL fold metallo-hydrolase [Chloroflexota bacterium]